MILLPEDAEAGGSFAVKWTFKESNGTAPTVLSLTYTLMDIDENIMNSLQDVAVAAPTAEETIVLSGADLDMSDETNAEETRILLIEATYDPEDGGDPVPLKEWAQFTLVNTPGYAAS